MKLETGQSCSKNFVLDQRIDNFEQFQNHVENNPSIFWGQKLYPCAFVISLQYRILNNSIKNGRVWSVKSKI